MAARQRLLTFWVLMLLAATLCPGSLGKRGGSRSPGKGDGDKASQSHGRGLSKKGLKWAGAAAGGILGGTGTGYGLGILGKPKHGTGNHHNHKTEQHQQPHHQESQKQKNQSLWRAFVRGSAPATGGGFFLALGYVVPFLTTAWIRGV
uniref:Period circadian protein-like n=1 Tax=Fundulus heteroclitus TaxID=8078 RepID=A0A146ZRS5_FUNHE